MLRKLSLTLVSLIILLTPISFSSEKIPDFSPEYTLSMQFHPAVAVASIDGTPAVRIRVPDMDVQTYASISNPLPPVVWSKNDSFGRAPPA
jgi:hypothetical protein